MISGFVDDDGFLQLVQALFPDGVATAMALADDEVIDASFHVKHPVVSGAVPSRQREFAAGRRAVERAQAMLGLAPRPVMPGPDRAPEWPDGLCGSISHSGGICLAAVAENRRFLALGIDIEADAPLPEGIGPSVMSPGESLRLAEINNATSLETVVFSAKEAVYKAQYPLTGLMIGFDAVDVTLDVQRGRFTARFTRNVGRFAEGSSVGGRFLLHRGLIVCAVALPRAITES